MRLPFIHENFDYRCRLHLNVWLWGMYFSSANSNDLIVINPSRNWIMFLQSSLYFPSALGNGGHNNIKRNEIYYTFSASCRYNIYLQDSWESLFSRFTKKMFVSTVNSWHIYEHCSIYTCICERFYAIATCISLPIVICCKHPWDHLFHSKCFSLLKTLCPFLLTTVNQLIDKVFKISSSPVRSFTLMTWSEIVSEAAASKSFC